MGNYDIQTNDGHRVLVGTSGFSYAEWRGTFYPEGLSQKKYLSFYAGHFPTTEINNTFYRLPTAKLTGGWYAEVPDRFSFTLKLSQKITHIKRLRNVDEEVAIFFSAAEALQEKMGPVLVQLPPNLRKDTAVLEEFLSKFSTLGRLAFEFRHESWFEAEVYDLLRRYNSALGVVEKEGDESAAVREVTGPFVYMRLRKGDYTEPELKEWAGWIKSREADVYCYLKHDELAPVLANRLIEALVGI
ncbi:MAG TPA: DUF72 domain-containing protein [Blastocatellia bacterium]|nr:DUF72 domain-containing protein [Blastocatellia bacterium]